MPNPNPPLRFRYSLRGLLVAMTVIAGALAVAAIGGILFGRIVHRFVQILLPTPLVVAVCYGRGDIRTFSIGALVPCVYYWIAAPGDFGPPWGQMVLQLAVLAASGWLAIATRRWLERSQAAADK